MFDFFEYSPEKQKRFARFYMDLASRVAQESQDIKVRVGAVLVNREGIIISYGWNGMPPGFDNDMRDDLGMTRPEVAHAERNAIDKAARSGMSTKNTLLFVTHSPCLECAKSIYMAGISHVFFENRYRCEDGIHFLNKCKIEVNQLEKEV